MAGVPMQFKRFEPLGVSHSPFEQVVSARARAKRNYAKIASATY